MHRCFADPADWGESGAVRLSSSEEHHLLSVLRAKPGDTAAVFDGQGREALVLIERVRPLILKIMKETKAVRPKVSLMLVQALPKGQRMDLIVEKCVELGVSSIIPVITERVITRLNEEQRRERAGRWSRVALSAAKQCGLCWVPDIRPILDFDGVIGELKTFDLLLVGVLSKARNLHSVIEENRKKSLCKVGFIIGPEGDLTEKEIGKAIDAGAIPVSFGSLVLRVETAALYGASVLAYEFFSGLGPQA